MLRVFETSANVSANSPSPDDQNLRPYDINPGFKPFMAIVKVVYKVLGINALGTASNSFFNTLQLTRNDHQPEKKNTELINANLKT